MEKESNTFKGPEAGPNTENPKSMKELHVAGGKSEAERRKWGCRVEGQSTDCV